MDTIINTCEINQSRKGVTCLDVPSKVLIKKLAEFYKEKGLIKLPKYTVFAKTSRARELSPIDPDWFFTKAASLTRRIYITKSHTLGIGALKVITGKRQRRGASTNTFRTASGKVIRDIVTQLRKNGYVENYVNSNGPILGLCLTRLGRGEVDKIATRAMKK